MTIASFQVEAIGARDYQPAGPFTASGTYAFGEFRSGFVVRGDAEGEWVYVLYRVVTAPVTINQGDVFLYDNAFNATPCLTATATRGMGVGTAFFGGRFGDPAAVNAPFSATLTAAGNYGFWLQRSGVTMLNGLASAVAGQVASTSTTAKAIDAQGTPTTGSKLIVGAYVATQSGTFTANTATGSAVLSAPSNLVGLEVGMLITGTGIPTGTTIIDISGGTVTMSALATATNTGTTVTWQLAQFVATTTNGSPTLTGIAGIAGIYPNQSISGTGIAGGATILSINGNSGNYTITMSANATASGTVTITQAGYLEGYLRGPCYIDKTN